jgi:hypothetical protein
VARRSAATTTSTNAAQAEAQSDPASAGHDEIDARKQAEDRSSDAKTYPTLVSKGWKIIAELEKVFSQITRITPKGCQNEIENLYQVTEIVWSG